MPCAQPSSKLAREQIIRKLREAERAIVVLPSPGTAETISNVRSSRSTLK
jgi:hypothetical protein